MKTVLTFICCVGFLSVYAQMSPSQKWEKAQYKISHEPNEKILKTTFEFQSLTEDIVSEFASACHEKEEIIEIKFFKNSIYVFHLNSISFNDIKKFLIPFSEAFNITESIELNAETIQSNLTH